MPRRRLNDRQVAALKPRDKRYHHVDPELVGHYVRVLPSGVKSFAAVARDAHGKQIWVTIGSTNHLKIEEARDQAREAIKRIKSGAPAFEAPAPAADSLGQVADNWLTRHVRAKGLRTAGEIERTLRKYILPGWGSRVFVSIGRGDISKLLDHVQDNHGPRQADAVLTLLSSIMRWHATRVDGYNPPVVSGMRRTSQKKKSARKRILSDDELKLIWNAADQAGSFGALVQLALLTGQRENKLITMRWSDISADGVWTVPVAEREKGAGGDLALPRLALDVLRRQERAGELVFPPSRGKTICTSHLKTAFVAGLPKMEQWGIHDLRRTARSLMARAGVPPEHGERVLGHVIGGVQGIYDRHAYRDEKRIALAKLATLIGAIVSGTTATVTPLRGRQIT